MAWSGPAATGLMVAPGPGAGRQPQQQHISVWKLPWRKRKPITWSLGRSIDPWRAAAMAAAGRRGLGSIFRRDPPSLSRSWWVSTRTHRVCTASRGGLLSVPLVVGSMWFVDLYLWILSSSMRTGLTLRPHAALSHQIQLSNFFFSKLVELVLLHSPEYLYIHWSTECEYFSLFLQSHVLLSTHETNRNRVKSLTVTGVDEKWKLIQNCLQGRKQRRNSKIQRFYLSHYMAVKCWYGRSRRDYLTWNKESVKKENLKSGKWQLNMS